MVPTRLLQYFQDEWYIIRLPFVITASLLSSLSIYVVVVVVYHVTIVAIGNGLLKKFWPIGNRLLSTFGIIKMYQLKTLRTQIFANQDIFLFIRTFSNTYRYG